MDSLKSVYVDGVSRHSGMHLAALRTLPGSFSLSADTASADVIAGDATFLRDALINGACAKTVVVVDPFTQDWRMVDELWAVASELAVRVEIASIAVQALSELRDVVQPIVAAASPYLAEVHLESLGGEPSRLAQVIEILSALAIECPTPDLHATADGWAAGINDDRVTLRAHAVNSVALPPKVRVTLTNRAHKVVLDVPLGPDATPVTTTTYSASGTTTVQAPFVSPARAFWIAIA